VEKFGPRVRTGRCWRGDLNDVGLGEHRRGALSHAGVQVAHDAADRGVTGKCSRGVLARFGLGLVVLGVDLERPAGDGVAVVRLLHGELDGVLDPKAESRQVAGQRCHDADLDDLVTVRRAGACIASGAAC